MVLITPNQRLALSLLDRGEHYDYALFCCQIPEDYAKEGEFILRLLQKGYIKLEVTDRGREVLGEFDD